ncbi:hypothetical protein AB8O55_29645 [Saccharopolyspora cebuensis]|uniref:Uncharacterized protein n=1 Tax=Saccharopolyspora cebuensis TaxID=418759 RepID=A0ABV4CR73_9PSEU
MNLLRARLSAGMDRRADRRAHYFGTDCSPDPDRPKRALCGFSAHPSVLELVADNTEAMPCEACVAHLPTEVAPPADRRDTTPPGEPSKHYSVGLRDGKRWHTIPEHPVIDVYEGRQVVVTECGVIGFLLFGSPPPSCSRCDVCLPDEHATAQADSHHQQKAPT